MKSRSKFTAPYEIDDRLWKQASRLLEQLEIEDKEVDFVTVRSKIEKALTYKTEDLKERRIREALEAEPEGVSLGDRRNTLLVITRIYSILAGLGDSGEEEDAVIPGSTARKYSRAFGAKTNAVSSRRTRGRAPARNNVEHLFTNDTDDEPA